jgi:putative addiction module component (TIGR02574 family)
MNDLLEQSLKLPIPERIRLVEEIWDSIAEQQNADSVELTPAQTAELERRIEYHERHPNDTVPWEAVRDNALARR